LRLPRIAGSLLLASALLTYAVLLFPETRIGRLPLNDGVLHLAASERLAQSVAHGEPFLDPWVSEWALGYPVWRSYQPLPHLAAGAVIAAARPLCDAATAFAWLQYLLLVLLPASVYFGARRLGLSPLAAGLASLLVAAPAGAGNFARYGLGWGATTWRGSGLYTQLFALHFLMLAVGATARALDDGRARVGAAVLLALTFLSHLVFGYVAFVSAAVLALVGPPGERARRVVRLATIALPALLLVAWFVIPLVRAAPEIAHSRWEDSFKWDSFGAPTILGALFHGDFFDGGRFPSLTLLVAAGAVVALASVRDALARRLLALAGLWLLLFFGRETWGHLLVVAGIPRDFPLHRLQAPFELFAILLAAFGITRAVAALAALRRPLVLAAVGAVAIALVPVAVDRAHFAAKNRDWGDANLAAFSRERADWEATLADIRSVLTERPGRVSAGPAGGWGHDFKIGDVPIYALLSRAHLDQPSMLYHAMSLTADPMVLRSDDDAANDATFGIRVLVAPSDRAAAPWRRRHAVHGRFAVYEASSEGYFGIVDPVARYLGPPATRFDVDRAWLAGPLSHKGLVLLLDDRGPALPTVDRWAPLPDPPPLPAAGRVASETKSGEHYHARVAATRATWALVKITWFPDLVATVDGAPAPLLRVTPGFGAVAVPPGEHDVDVSYRPGPLKPILFVLGLALFVAFARARRRGRVDAIEERATATLASWGERVATPSALAGLAAAALFFVALHPLFRGLLVDGHDSVAYPPRLIEFDRALADGQLPPLWAPDLGNGHGQPLFEFAPPLVYLVAVPFQAAGASTADALQLGLALLFAAGALAIYRLARRLSTSRTTAFCTLAAWLVAPYLALDLFVRGAFAEAAALAVAPLALWSLIAALDAPSASRIALAALALALIPLSHTGIALLVFPAFALIAAAVAWTSEHRARTALAAAGVFVGALALSAFAWLPALVEKDLTKTALLRQDFLRWSDHTVSFAQLLWSPWGYGVSVAGVADGMSFALGPLHLLLAVAGVALVARQPRQQRQRALILASAAIALGGAVLSTSWAAPIWSRLPALQYVAYPWRALMLAALFLPLTMIALFEQLPRRYALFLIALLVAFNLPHSEPKRYLAYDDEYYAPHQIAAGGITTTTREEYEPRWVETRPPYRDARLVGLDAPLTIVEQRIGSRREDFTVRTSALTRVESALFYYPRWQLRIDGVAAPAELAPKSGLIVFRLVPGEHRVELELRSTPVRTASLLVSLVALLALLGVAIYPAWRRRGRPAS
jgi:uncharacterized membrane protein